MTDISCNYPGDREQTLIAYLYDEIDAAERAAFDAHLPGCARCTRDVAALGGVRRQLAEWQPPQFTIHNSQLTKRTAWWRQLPAWAQVAAALLFVGVSAGVANLDVRYDANGLSIRTGWSKPAAAPPVAQPFRAADAKAADATAADGTAAGVTRQDLTALEQQLRSEIRSAQAAQPARAASTADTDTVRRVRALVDESEKRQQRELALRIAQVLRDVGAQRQADLSKIDRNLGVIQNTTGVEILKQREMVNYLMRVSQRQ